MGNGRRGRARASVVLALAAVAAAAPFAASTGLAKAAGPADPPIRHVWVIDLENGGFYFGPGDLSGADYQSFYDQIASLGNFVEGYFSIGHNSLDNYIAQVSGQAPNPQTQEDCPVNTDWEPPGASVLNPLGQAVGQGCLLPANVPTLGDQLDTAFAGGGHATWKGYMEGMGTDPSTGYATTCAQGGVNGGDASSPGAYAGKHDPFIWFHGIIDSVQRCDAHVVPLSQLPADLSSVDTTPNFSWITPTLCNDGHDCGSAGFQPWLEKYLPIITSSPAYRQDGMIVLTYDEQAVASIPGIAPPLEVASCCNEIPGPNAPNPGVGGPGGGIVGAIVLSPFVEPATFTPCTWPSTGDGRLAQPTCVSGPMFNHYSALRTFEDLFGITSGGTDGAGHIGYAATPNPGHFGCATSPAPDGTAGDVFDGICPPPYDGSPVPPLTTSAVSGLTGPRPADGAFTWQQTVNGNDLNAVSCAPQSPAVCVAVGKVGTVLASVDAGATWHAQPTALARNLNGVSCDMSITCVAVGDDGVVLTRTSSLGAWQKQPSPTNGDLSAVSCAPESAVCVAVGRGGVVIGSADAGTTWSAVPTGGLLPTQGTDTTPDLTGVSCPAPTDCYAVGLVASGFAGNIVHLAGDGRGTWTPSLEGSLPARLLAISCTSPTSCLAAGDGNANGGVVTLSGSTVAYASGAIPGTPVDSNGDVVPGEQNVFDAISCGAPPACVIGAARPYGTSNGPLPNAQTHASIITTTDAGAHFSLADSGTYDTINGVSCMNPQPCVAVGDGGTIIRSSDAAGASWSSANASPSQPLYAASCVGATCLAVGGAQPFEFTPDGAFTTSETNGAWASQSLTPPPPANVSQRLQTDLDGVSCATPTLCVAVGSYNLVSVASANSASPTWSWSFHTVQLGAANGLQTQPMVNLRGVSCPALQGAAAVSCVAVGDNGTMLASEDNGTSWAREPIPAGILPLSLSGVSCPDASDCVAVGAQGTVLSTHGSGLTSWSAGAANTKAFLSGVTCMSADVCVAVGEGGLILRSADGGATWAQVASGVGDDLASVSCGDASHCVAAGSNGAVVASTDGGKSWFAQGSGTDRRLWSVSCSSAESCLLVGDSGAILQDEVPANPAPNLPETPWPAIVIILALPLVFGHQLAVRRSRPHGADRRSSASG